LDIAHLERSPINNQPNMKTKPTAIQTSHAIRGDAGSRLAAAGVALIFSAALAQADIIEFDLYPRLAVPPWA
jgi:hypothetical protein